MQTRVLLTTVTLGLGVLSASCTTSSTTPKSTCSDIIVSHAEPTIDVSKLRTFAVADETFLDAALPDDLPDDTVTNLRIVTQAAKTELLALGLMEVDPEVETPDVWLFNVATTQTKADQVWGCSGGWVWWGWGWAWDACAWTTPVEVTYDVGTVVVGLADEASEKVVFAGAMQGVLDCGDAVERIDGGVKQIFADYPKLPED